MRVLITGVTGFVGPHLVEALSRHGSHEIIGASLRGDWPDGFGHLSGSAQLRMLDLREADQVESLLRETEPQWLFHLAGYAHVGKSFREPNLTWDTNLGVTRTLYDAVARWGGKPRILYVSTGLVYGDPLTPEWFCDEDTPFRPASPYAASKAAADLLSYQVTRQPGLDVVRVRPFNHIGPGQSADYAVPNFARQIAAVEQGRQPPTIETGDLSGQRDLTDVRDVARAYIALLEQGQAGEAYNVASGVTRRIGDVLEMLLRLSNQPIQVHQQIDPSRAKDTAVTRARVEKIRRFIGWEPMWELEQSLRDILNWWRQQ